MAIRRILCFALVIVLLQGVAFSEDLNLDDINFAFDSRAVIDDIKQLDRLTAFLVRHPELYLEINGHADWIGKGAYNQNLSVNRAYAVKEHLLKRGVAGGRIEIKGFGESQPKESNATIEGRFINRRVVFNIYALEKGERVYYYKDNSILRDIDEKAGEAAPLKQSAAAITVAESKEQTEREGEKPSLTAPVAAGISESTEAVPAASQQASDKIPEQPVRQAGATPAAAAATTESAIEAASAKTAMALREQPPQEATASSAPSAAPYQTVIPLYCSNRASISAALGSDDGELTGGIEGKFFIPLNDQFALQGGLTGNINRDIKEYQFDGGAVGRIDRIQIGLFASALATDLDGFDSTATLSQASLSLSYLLPRGSIGLFATQPIKLEDVIAVEQSYKLADLMTTETYLKVRDSYGIFFDYSFEKGLFVEGNLGFIDADEADVAGRFKAGYSILPEKNLDLFIRCDFNGGFIGADRDNVTVIAGIELGRWRPSADSSCKLGPMQIPSVSYELKKRTSILEAAVNTLPLASISASAVKGPAPLAVIFSGAATDPDGTVQSYHWKFGDGSTAEGQTVSHTFTTEGSYLVEMTVTDNDGGATTESIVITVANLRPQVVIETAFQRVFLPVIVRFTGNGYDPDGSIVEYRWDFGDGTTAAGQSVTHTYTDAGTYQVTLTARDNDGAETSAITHIRANSFPF